MKKLLVAMIAIGTITAQAEEQKKVEVTCWNQAGTQILKEKALYAFSEGRNGTSNVKILTTTSDETNPDYYLFNATCVIKKL